MYRELELKYDKLYKEVYDVRNAIINGKAPTEQQLKEYEERAKALEDEDF